MSENRLISGTGLCTTRADGAVLDAWFPAPHPTDTPDMVDAGALRAGARDDPRRNVRVHVTACDIDLDAPPVSAVDAYLRLHALSHLLAAPNTVNLDGLFGLLPTVAWTTAGPVHPDDLDRLRPGLRAAGIHVRGIDKFPPLLDYVTPRGVRIADASRVRLGAHLSPGTTVMHEGFVNFNAGTLGASMVEGRISQGVVVGDGSDIGGGSSIMGTLSGGGTHRVSIGRRCLLGANAGIGISLGDDCVVEAGLYVTGGTKVVLADEALRADGTRPTVKAAALSGASGMLYWRNSLTGAIEARHRDGAGIALNDALHA